MAFLVFIFHIGASGAPSFVWQTAGLPHTVMLSLQLSVEVFFCISGYVVTGTLQRSRGPGAFLRNRAVRILPVLWVSLAVVVPLGLAVRQGVFATMPGRDLVWVLPANMLPLAGALPIPVLHLVAWSLSYEFLFYLLAAALWWLPPARYFSRAATILAAACLIACHPRAVFFLVGVCVARFDIVDRPWVRHAVRAPGLLLSGFFALWYFVQFGGTVTDGTVFDLAQDGRIVLAAVSIVLATSGFAGIVAGQGWLGILLRTPPLQRLGTISFSFYLWHVIVIGVAKRLLAMAGGYAWLGAWSQLCLAAVCFPASLLIATVSVRLIEQDLASWLRR